MRVKVFFILSMAICLSGLTACGSETTSISYADAANALGLESGKAYPLVTGDKITGTEGNVTTTQGFFSSTTSINLSVGSAVTVIFKKDDREWHLEIPTSKTTFIINDARPQTVILRIDGFSDFDNYGSSKMNGCKLWINESWKPLGSDCNVHLSDTVRDAGLGPIVQQALISATFTVSQATADQLSGKK